MSVSGLTLYKIWLCDQKMWTNPGYILRYKPVINNPSLYRIQPELNCARVAGVLDLWASFNLHVSHLYFNHTQTSIISDECNAAFSLWQHSYSIIMINDIRIYLSLGNIMYMYLRKCLNFDPIIKLQWFRKVLF